MQPTLDELVSRVADRVSAAAPDRVIIGITGVPGAGKTTLALRLVAALAEVLGADAVAHVPMDGYHLADVELERIGRRDAKGAPDTFDALGYIALLRRLRENADDVVYVPGFDRELEQPVAGSIPVFRSARVIVSEGNYLLLDGAWSACAPAFDEVWFVSPPEALRQERLLARHVQFGKTPEFAAEWIAATDEPNAALVLSTRSKADLEIEAD